VKRFKYSYIFDNHEKKATEKMNSGFLRVMGRDDIKAKDWDRRGNSLDRGEKSLSNVGGAMIIQTLNG
jgi:hypothetical protein